MQLESFKQLIVWQRSIELVKEIYKITDEFPKSELYGLVSQMRRAAISISSNIAEGYKRKNLGEYVQFLSIADSSAAELETQLIIAKDLYVKINFSRALSLIEEVQKILITLIKKLNPKPSTLNPQGGQIMVEALIAITIAVVGLLGIFAFLSQSLGLNRNVANRYVATYLAAEGIELVKNIADGSSWGGFINTACAEEYEISYEESSLSCFTDKFLKFDPSTGVYGYRLGENTKFKRKIVITEPQPGVEVQVVSEVTWEDRGGVKMKIDLEDHFFNLKQQ
jgi:four helix bundle protein